MLDFFERLDRRLNPDLYRSAQPPSAPNSAPPPTTYAAYSDPQSTVYSEPQPRQRIEERDRILYTSDLPKPRTFQARTIEIPVQTIQYQQPVQARTIEIPVQTIQYQQPARVQVVQEPVLYQQPPVQRIQYKQPVPVQVVEAPVLQVVEVPPPEPPVVVHTEVRLVPRRNGRLAEGFGYGGLTGYEYGLGNDFAYDGAPPYAMPSMYSGYPLEARGDPSIPPPSRFPLDPVAGAPFTPYRGGRGMVTPRSAKRSLAYGGGRESAYLMDL